MRSKILIFVLSLMLVSAFAFSADNFEKGGKYVTPQVGLNSWAIPFGASYGVGITDNIEVGVSVMVYFWSESFFGYDWSYTVITPSLEGAYHFTTLELPVDVFAGLSLGYSIFSLSDGSGNDYAGAFGSSLYLSPFIGARYFFKDKYAVSLKAYFSAMGDLSGAGAVLGLTIALGK